MKLPGKHITDQQIRLYMMERKQNTNQIIAAAKAGISERSGRRIDNNKLTPHPKEKRHWRTRQDPLAQVWEPELVPLLENEPQLQPITLLEYLQSKYPGRFNPAIKRTLQRRIKQWKLRCGPEKEVIFRQTHEPGHMGISDFTELKDIEISIAGEVLDHRLYHYRLVFSRWSSVKVILGGESFSALSMGLQDAFWRSGGVPREHRTDSLSAAYNNLSEREALTQNYQGLARHYGFKPTRNNPGKSHENGSIESPHGHLKRRMKQALLLRGSNDFTDLDAYQHFIDSVVKAINAQNKPRYEQEKAYLLPLPKRRTHDYTEHAVFVSSSSTITLKRVLYTVPSRLIGQRLTVQLYDDRLALYSGHLPVATLSRVYAKGQQRRRCVDYRHVIHSLVRKPQAFRYSQIREDLLPSGDYQSIWTYVDQHLAAQKACKYIVRLLALAAHDDCEQALGRYVSDAIENARLPSIDQCQRRFGHVCEVQPIINSRQHALAEYDQLLSQEVVYG
jgi:transposase InsO family protein